MTKIIKYFGGKGSMVAEILKYLPPRQMYIEPFGGSATVLFAQSTPVEIYNDKYNNVHALFKTIQDPALFAAFRLRCELSPYSQELRREQKELLKQQDISILDRAFAYFYVNRTSHNGEGGFSANIAQRRGMAKCLSDFLSAVAGLTEYHERLRSVIIMNTDAVELIKKYGEDKTAFFYLDPPYHWSTRTEARYPCDMTDEGHNLLLAACLQAKAQILISGYDCAAYDVLQQNGWHRVSFVVNTTDGAHAAKTKTETLWYNYELPQAKLSLF